MNGSKRIALSRPNIFNDSDSAYGDDYEDDNRSHKKAGGKDKVNRNLSEKKRRDQFNILVNELCTMVSTTNKKMDKSTVLKSTIAFLKSHQETTDQAHVHEIKEYWKPSFLTNDEFMHLMLEALDSFLLVFSQQGVILYASESITSLLGHLPGDMVNKSIYDLVSNQESAKLQNLLYNYRVSSGNGVPDYEKEENQLCFDCSFRRGNIDPHAPVTYEPVTIRGSFRYNDSNNTGNSNNADDEDTLQSMCAGDNVCFCSTVRLQTSKLVRQMSIVDDNKEFTSKHSLEWKFLFLDHRAPPIVGYLPFEVLGTSGYDYYHPDDLEEVTKSHEQLMKTGEGTSCYFRFLTKGQQWIWLKTCYFITYHQWNSKPEFINCTNIVVNYADVRTHKRKELGIIVEEEFSVASQPETGLYERKEACSPSVGSVTSMRQQESGHYDRKEACSPSVGSVTSMRQQESGHYDRKEACSPSVGSVTSMRQQESGHYDRKEACSPSVGSVTSMRQQESNCSSSLDSFTDQNSGAMSDKDSVESSPYPTSTSHIRSHNLSEQLNQFLQRQLQEQALSPAPSAIATQQQQQQNTTSTTSASSIPLQQFLYRRQQQHQHAPQRQKQQQQQEVHFQKILPRPNGATIARIDHTNRPALPDSPQQQQQQKQQQHIGTDTVSRLEPGSSNQTVLTVTPLSMTVNVPVPRNLFMTPVQRQLHEQLQRKARQVQEAIMKQQLELSRITQQLTFAQGNLPLMNNDPDTMLSAIGDCSQSSDLDNPSSQPLSLSQYSHHHQQQPQQQQQQPHQHPHQHQQHQQQLQPHPEVVRSLSVSPNPHYQPHHQQQQQQQQQQVQAHPDAVRSLSVSPNVLLASPINLPSSNHLPYSTLSDNANSYLSLTQSLEASVNNPNIQQ